MKHNDVTEELSTALKLDVDATLDSADAKEKLVKSLNKEIKAVDSSVEATLLEADAKDKLRKAINNEIDASNVSAESALDLAVKRERIEKRYDTLETAMDIETDSSVDVAESKEKLKKLYDENSVAVDVETDAALDLAAASEKRIGQLEKLMNATRVLIDYTERLTTEQKEQVKQKKKRNDRDKEQDSEEESEETKSPKGSGSQDKDQDKTAKKVKKELETQIFGLFSRINRRLKEIGSTSESGWARVFANGMLGAQRFVSDEINNYIDKVPGLGTLNRGRRFIKEQFADAKEAKLRRLTREQTGKDGKSARGAGLLDSVRRKRDEKARSNQKEKDGDLNDNISGIRKTLEDMLSFQKISSALSLMTNITTSMFRMIKDGLIAAFNFLGLTKVLGAIAGALGVKGLASAIPDIDIPGTVDTKGKTTADPGKAGKGSPKPTTPSPKPKKGVFDKIRQGASGLFSKISGKGAASVLARVGTKFLGPIGLASFMYDIASMAGLTDEFDKFMADVMNDLVEKFDLTDEEREQHAAHAEQRINGGDQSELNQANRTFEQSGPTQYGPKIQPTTTTTTTTAVGPLSAGPGPDNWWQRPIGTDALGRMEGVETGNAKVIDPIIRQYDDSLQRTQELMQEYIRVQSEYQSSNMSVNSQTVNNNNTTNLIQFGQPGYQTTYQKGSMIDR